MNSERVEYYINKLNNTDTTPEKEEIYLQFAMWCAKSVRHLLDDDVSKKMFQVCESFLGRRITLNEFKNWLYEADKAAQRAKSSAAYLSARSIESAAQVIYATASNGRYDYIAARALAACADYAAGTGRLRSDKDQIRNAQATEFFLNYHKR